MVKVNRTSYTSTDTADGSTYTVGLLFALEDGETERDLGKDRINALRLTGTAETVDTTTTGALDTIIPVGLSAWTGIIAGEALEAPDPNSILQRITYGDFSVLNVEGTQQQVCVREVLLEYEPETFNDNESRARPPNVSQGNDPDLWFPEFSRTTGIYEELAPMQFLGYWPAATALPNDPINPGNPNLLATPFGPDQNAFQQPLVNSMGDELRPIQNQQLFYSIDRYIEYGTRFIDTAANRWTREQVVNDQDVTIRTAVGGVTAPWPAEVQYEAGTAMLTQQTIQSRFYKFRNGLTGATARIPYFVRTTDFAIKARGWTLNKRNTGKREIRLLQREKIRLDDGPITTPTGLNEFGASLASPEAAGFMIYAPLYSNFVGLIGTSLGGGIFQVT